MARVKPAVHSKKQHRAVLARARGYYGNKSRSYRAANEQVMHSLQYVPRPSSARASSAGCGSNASTPPAVRTARRTAVHRRSEDRRGRGRPQGPGRPGRARPRGLQRPGEDGRRLGATGLTPVAPQSRVQRLRRLASRRSARVEERAFVIEGPTLLAARSARGRARIGVRRGGRRSRGARGHGRRAAEQADRAGVAVYELADGVSPGWAGR